MGKFQQGIFHLYVELLLVNRSQLFLALFYDLTDVIKCAKLHTNQLQNFRSAGASTSHVPQESKVIYNTVLSAVALACESDIDISIYVTYPGSSS